MRRLLPTLGVALLVVLAGCAGLGMGGGDRGSMPFMNHTTTGDGDDGRGTNMPANTGPNVSLQGSELVTFKDQVSGGKKVVVQSITVPEGGYAAIHTMDFLDNRTRSVIGVSEYLSPGTHENVTVTVFTVPGKQFNESAHLMGEPRLLVVAHRETTDTQTFEYVSTRRAEDVPYRNETGAIAVDSAVVTIKPGLG